MTTVCTACGRPRNWISDSNVDGVLVNPATGLAQFIACCSRKHYQQLLDNGWTSPTVTDLKFMFYNARGGRPRNDPHVPALRYHPKEPA